jgi:hypothetical protein
VSTPSPSADQLYAESAIDELAHIFALYANPTRNSPEPVLDDFRLMVLSDRQSALENLAETSPARSMKGAALKLLLAGHRATELNADLCTHDLDDCERVVAESMERSAQAATRSGYTFLAAHGGDLPAVIVDYYASSTFDMCFADLTAKGEAVRPH